MSIIYCVDMKPILIDASYLVALNYVKDPNHASAVFFEQTHRFHPLIPDIALGEVWHVMNGFVGHQRAASTLKRILDSQAEILCVQRADLIKAHEIMLRYADGRLDLVDCCIFALAERLNIKQVCSFDRRDFLIFRNEQGEALELLP